MIDMDREQEFASYLATFSEGPVDLGQALCGTDGSEAGLALVYETNGREQYLSYAGLAAGSRALAGALAELGIQEGDRVAVLLPKSPELLITLVAIWRAGAVHVPLFTAFGPDAVRYRLAHSQARLVITDAENRDKVGQVEGALQVLHVGTEKPRRSRDADFATMVGRADPRRGIASPPSAPLIILYTSGTTGKPKGVPIPVRALASFKSYMRHGIDLRPEDRPWNFGDPGWGYGLYYGVLGMLLARQTILWRSGRFDAQDFYDALLRHQITNLSGAPTVYRALRAAGVPGGFRDSHELRAISSAGEPLNPELIKWAERDMGLPIRDHYGQSETGMVVFHSQQPGSEEASFVPGSMGIPAPGIRTVLLDADGAEVTPGNPGELAIDTEHSPGYWFGGYVRDPERTAERFRFGPRYYLTGDTVRLDQSSRLFYVSRADDVITSSGYRIGPFDVESALIAHPAVMDVAVIGTPDERRVEVVTAYVVLSPGTSPTQALTEQLQQYVRTRLGKHLYPRRVVFTVALPRTPSGKVQRTELRRDWEARVKRAGTQEATEIAPADPAR